MNNLKVIILDDEEEASDILSSLLKDTGKVKILKILKNLLQLESSVAKLKPDAVFTDIQMPGYNGLDILENIREYNPTLPVVYVSAHKKFVLEAAKHSPFSYLLYGKEIEIGISNLLPVQTQQRQEQLLLYNYKKN